MNILHICFSKGFGGLEMYVPRIAIEQQNINNNIMILCKKDTKLENIIKEKNLKYKSFKYTNYLNIYIYLKVNQIIKEFKPDIVHIHLSKDLFIASTILKNKNNIKLFFTEQMGNTYNKKDFIHKSIYSRINKIIAISKLVQERNLKYLPITKEQSVLLYYGLEIDKYNLNYNKIKKTLNKKYNIKNDSLKIGLVGRITPNKGHKLFLKSALKILKKYSDIYFFIIGTGDNDLENELKNFVNKNNINKNIIFTGFIENIPEYMCYMDLTVMASTNEAFGLVVIESMAAKTPVIGANAGAIPEIINNNCGRLFENNNVDSLTENIEFYIKNRDLIKEHGQNGYNLVCQKFSMKTHLQSLMKIYKES